MQVFPRAAVQHSGEWGRLEGPKNEVWMMLHLCVAEFSARMSLLFRVEEWSDEI